MATAPGEKWQTGRSSRPLQPSQARLKPNGSIYVLSNIIMLSLATQKACGEYL